MHASAYVRRGGCLSAGLPTCLLGVSLLAILSVCLPAGLPARVTSVRASRRKQALLGGWRLLNNTTYADGRIDGLAVALALFSLLPTRLLDSRLSLRERLRARARAHSCV